TAKETMATSSNRYVLILEDGSGDRHPLIEGRTTIGRSAECDIVIADDSVSRQHAALLVEAERIELTDLTSRNHTFRNESAVLHSEVACGDRLRFGNVPASLEKIDCDGIDRRTPSARAIRRSDTWSAADALSVVDGSRVMRLFSDIACTLATALPFAETL